MLDFELQLNRFCLCLGKCQSLARLLALGAALAVVVIYTVRGRVPWTGENDRAHNLGPVAAFGDDLKAEFSDDAWVLVKWLACDLGSDFTAPELLRRQVGAKVDRQLGKAVLIDR